MGRGVVGGAAVGGADDGVVGVVVEAGTVGAVELAGADDVGAGTGAEGVVEGDGVEGAGDGGRGGIDEGVDSRVGGDEGVGVGGGDVGDGGGCEGGPCGGVGLGADGWDGVDGAGAAPSPGGLGRSTVSVSVRVSPVAGVAGVAGDSDAGEDPGRGAAQLEHHRASDRLAVPQDGQRTGRSGLPEVGSLISSPVYSSLLRVGNARDSIRALLDRSHKRVIWGFYARKPETKRTNSSVRSYGAI